MDFDAKRGWTNDMHARKQYLIPIGSKQFKCNTSARYTSYCWIMIG